MVSEVTIAQAVADRFRAGVGLTRFFGITLDDTGADLATISTVLGDEALNGFGAAHGGVIFTLADTAFAYACNIRNVATVAQSATIAFPGSGRTGERIVAVATEIAVVGRSGTYQVIVSGDDDRVVAT